MHHYRLIFALFSILFFVVKPSVAQEDDWLDELDSLSESASQYQLPAFKALQIANLQSTKLVGDDELYLIVAHRFGPVNQGIKEFFGLDQANTKIQLLYGIHPKWQVGVSRDSYEKTYSATSKWQIKAQNESMPVNIVLYNSMDINSQLSKDAYPGLLFFDRVAYTTQLLTSRRFSEKLSLEVAPIYVRQNLVDLNYTKTQTYNQYLLALGGRYKLSKRLSLNADYAYNFSKDAQSLYHNPLSIGVDIETGGHVFQLLFTNSRGSNDAAFLTESLADWTKGDISFGFNLVRVF